MNIKVRGLKPLINRYSKALVRIPDIIDRRLDIFAKKVYNRAKKYLSGGNAEPGSYPVPNRTGHLKSALVWLGADKSQIFEAGVQIKHKYAQNSAKIKTGIHEAKIVNFAHYSRVVHEGEGYHARFGKRQYMTDALRDFNSSGEIENDFSKFIIRTLI